MRPTGLAVLLAVLAVLGGCATVDAREKPLVFLLMGQSNMSGRGDPAEAPHGALTPDPRILLLGNDGVTRVAREPLDSAEGQLDMVSADRAAGVGHGLAFAKTLVASHPDRETVLVPCAKGGSAIAAWRPGSDPTTLYGSCLDRARQAQRQGRIAGVLWYQGESDAASSALAAAWPPAFVDLVANLRRDLNAPTLTVLMVSIADQPAAGPYQDRFPAWQTLQALQSSIQLPHVEIVSAKGLPRNDDELHLSTAGQIQLGQALALAWERRPTD